MSPPLSGHWQPIPHFPNVYYGSNCVSNNLLSCLPTSTSKAIIITGNSLATRTPLVQQLQTLLTPTHHAATISTITQHNPSNTLDDALTTILSLHATDPTIDTLISLGGGSPIDSAKILALRFHQHHSPESSSPYTTIPLKPLKLTHLSIPTTLSAAETTPGGGFTTSNGTKQSLMSPHMSINTIFYDPDYAKHTPLHLWLTTGIRALDHTIEAIYHPTASEIPWKVLALWAVKELFECLPLAKESHPDNDSVTMRLMLAAFASSGLKGARVTGGGLGLGMGLSHSLGYALGSPYGIPHGVTSCVTLGKVVGRQVARLCEAVGGVRTGDEEVDAGIVGERVEGLVEGLGLRVGSLMELGVGNGEVEVIAKRALRGVGEGVLFERVRELVEEMF
ncbi:Dehydroquinate synthase-like protein [Aspergillus sclerotioniger CBS 115572]|uniref:Dehydroquinate synthase-like protein n=1 Tax=Aspergillus sclerotioniger CBS 115572 TaxID=1450535 RepID=A0A317V1V7_9EURO|nr:Dehydroquinate synthase-like protein [Aspergillus sclerotioniger CBS 115572]PWY67986.1 Dehydroquinate synthase-like protein [Aspergillus sclerotioniger CBS 115572]